MHPIMLSWRENIRNVESSFFYRMTSIGNSLRNLQRFDKLGTWCLRIESMAAKLFKLHGDAKSYCHFKASCAPKSVSFDMLRIKYNSQTLACKQRQRCGWIGPLRLTENLMLQTETVSQRSHILNWSSTSPPSLSSCPEVTKALRSDELNVLGLTVTVLSTVTEAPSLSKHSTKTRTVLFFALSPVVPNRYKNNVRIAKKLSEL